MVVTISLRSLLDRKQPLKQPGFESETTQPHHLVPRRAYSEPEQLLRSQVWRGLRVVVNELDIAKRELNFDRLHVSARICHVRRSLVELERKRSTLKCCLGINEYIEKMTVELETLRIKEIEIWGALDCVMSELEALDDI